MFFADKTINFQTLTLFNMLFLLFIGLVAFLAQLQLLHVLRYNATIAMLGTTLKQCGCDLLAYALVGGIVFMAFVCVAALSFWDIKDYSSFGQVSIVVRQVNKIMRTHPTSAPNVFSSNFSGI